MLRKKIILKDLIREIKFNKKRFMYIIIVFALSVSFYLGFNLIFKNISKGALDYYKENNLMEIKISATTNLLKEDYYLIKKIDGIKGIMPVKTFNTKATTAKDEFELRVININSDRSKKNNDYINRLTLTNGRYPRTINEGLIEESFFKKNDLSIGDLITLKPNDNNYLKAKKIKIVGTVKNLYDKIDEKSNLIYLEERNFNYDYYNEFYITIDKNEKMNIFTDEYDLYIKKYEENIKNVLTPVVNGRYNENKKALENAIFSSQEELNSYYNLTFPEASLNDLIKQTSDDLKEAQKKLSLLKKPEIYLKKTNEITKFHNLKFKLNEIKKISKKLPITFLIVGVLISSYLILKIIMEEKKQIITLKTLGYINFSICFKYILYASLTSIIGSLIGLLLYKIFSLVIKTTYNISSLNTNTNLNFIIFFILFNIIINSLIVVLKIVRITTKPSAKLNYTNDLKQKTKISIKNKSFCNKIICNEIIKNKEYSFLIIIITSIFSYLLLDIFKLKNESFNNLNNNITIIIFISCFFILVLYFVLKDDINTLKNEIKMVKQLGFYDYEINNYGIKKNLILFFTGLVIGLSVGSSINLFKINLLIYIKTIFLIFMFFIMLNMIFYFYFKKINHDTSKCK